MKCNRNVVTPAKKQRIHGINTAEIGRAHV